MYEKGFADGRVAEEFGKVLAGLAHVVPTPVEGRPLIYFPICASEVTRFLEQIHEADLPIRQRSVQAGRGRQMADAPRKYGRPIGAAERRGGEGMCEAHS